MSPKQRLVLLFGCGGDRDKTKRAVMGRVAERLADRVILTSDNSRSENPLEIIEEIRQGISEACDCRIIPDRAEAIRFAVWNAEKGEIVLLAGKGHEKYEIVHSEKKYFCEREIVIDAYRARCERKNNEGTERMS